MKIRINKYVQLVCFALFFILCSIATFNKFKQTLFDYSYSGDETYFESIYDLKTADFELITSVRSQFYTFCSSLINLFINNPILSARVTSLVSFFLLFAYFINAIRKLKIAVIVKIQYIIILFFMLVLSGQVFIGVSDFTAYFFLIIFIIELNKILFKSKELTLRTTIFLAIFLALSIVNRPTVLIILAGYALGLLCIFKKQIFTFKYLLLIPLFSLFLIGTANYGSLKNTGKINLDVKEIPEEFGINWLEKNYLTAKFWEDGVNPPGTLASISQTVQYKKENPTAFMPKSHLDILMHEPILYAKQMVKTFVTANYSMFLQTNILYFLALFIIFKKYFNKNNTSEFNQSFDKKDVDIIELMLAVFIFVILAFSFLAIKLFEFRWAIPTMIILMWYVLLTIAKLNKNTLNTILTCYYIFITLWIIKGYKIFLLS